MKWLNQCETISKDYFENISILIISNFLSEICKPLKYTPPAGPDLSPFVKLKGLAGSTRDDFSSLLAKNEKFTTREKSQPTPFGNKNSQSDFKCFWKPNVLGIIYWNKTNEFASLVWWQCSLITQLVNILNNYANYVGEIRTYPVWE